MSTRSSRSQYDVRTAPPSCQPGSDSGDFTGRDNSAISSNPALLGQCATGIDPFAEELLTLSQAARFCPRHRQGKKPHSSTLYRWATRGSRGVVLDALRTPGGLVTTKAALLRFFTELSRARPLPLPHQTPAQDEQRHAAVEAELRRRFNI